MGTFFSFARTFLALSIFVLPTAAIADVNESKFQICDSEAFQALNMARSFFINKKNEDAVFRDFGSEEATVSLANDLFNKAKSGDIRHYADFAVEKLYACADREEFKVDKPKAIARVCYARVDIPFFLVVFREQGLTRQAAIDKVAMIFKDRELYPWSLIEVVADRLFPSSSIDKERKIMGTVFWSCMYPDGS